MPPIRRTQRPAGPTPRRRLAGHGHTGPAREDTPRDETAREDTLRDETAREGAAPSGDRVAGPVRDDDEAITAAAPAAGSDSDRRRRGVPACALAVGALVVGLVAAGTGAFLLSEPGVDVQNQAFVDRAATDEVLAAATANVQRLVAIDHRTLDEYHASLGEFLTPNLVEQLEENWSTLRETYEQSETTVDARVREAGLTFLEGDRAEVLLVQDVSMERGGAAAGSTSGTYLVGLDRVDGVWKLSRIPDLPS